MKKISLFITCIAIIATLYSCNNESSSNNQLKDDIEEFVGSEIKELSVEEIKKDSDFYKYTKEFNEIWNLRNQSAEKANEYFEYSVRLFQQSKYFENVGDEKNSQECKRSSQEFKYKSDSLWYLVSKYESMARELISEQQSGTLYVVKYYEKSKKDYFYNIFTYSKDGKLFQYDGNEAIKTICSVFPKRGMKLEKVFYN